MAADLIDGQEYTGKVVSAQYGNGGGGVQASAVVEVVDGASAGKKLKFTGSFKDERNSGFTMREMRAMGWAGKSVATFVSDVTGGGVLFQFKAEWAFNSKNQSHWWSAKPVTVAPLRKTTPEDDAKMDAYLAKLSEQEASEAPAGESATDDDLPF